MKNLVKMTRAEYTAAVANRTLKCPNVALISDEGRKVEYLYANPKNDVGIAAYENGVTTYYSVEEWEALETRPMALGAYIFADGVVRIIHSDLVSGTWARPDISVPGCFINPNQAQALLDMGGKANTEAVLAAFEAGTVTDKGIFAKVKEKTFANGEETYLPAAGELSIILENLVAINAARLACGQSAINKNQNIWTSSQFSANYSWSWHSTIWGDYRNYNSGSGLVLCAL